MRKFIRKIQNKSGTTLVEMMIAVTLFGVLIAIAVSNFQQTLRLQKLSSLLLEGHDNAGLVLEQITREVRTSTGLGGGVSFTDQYGQSVSYGLSGGAITRNGVPVTISNNPNIFVSGFNSYLSGEKEGVLRLTVSIQMTVKDSKNNSYTSTIQTSVSPRYYE